MKFKQLEEEKEQQKVSRYFPYLQTDKYNIMTVKNPMIHVCILHTSHVSHVVHVFIFNF